MLTFTVVFAALLALGHSAEPNLSSYLTKSQEHVQLPSVACATPTDGDSIYRYSIPHLNASQGVIHFSAFKGKPILLTNVATFCQSPTEYPVFNQIKEKFGNKIEIVGFPCNQFWNQEPSSVPEEIYNAIKYARPGKGFVPKFHLTKMIDVNGAQEDPIFSFLKRSCISTRTYFEDAQYLIYANKNIRDVKWNFEKFLIHPTTGVPVRRYDQKFKSEGLIADIEALLAAKH